MWYDRLVLVKMGQSNEGGSIEKMVFTLFAWLMLPPFFFQIPQNQSQTYNLNKKVIPFHQHKLSEQLIVLYIFAIMEKSNTYDIFFEERCFSIHVDLAVGENLWPDSIPYLRKGDSNVYLEQFLAQSAQMQNGLESKDYFSSSDQSYELLESGKYFHASAFHNFQKHLTISLKNTIEISPQQASPMEYQVAATKMWKIFKISSPTTKKILHYFLGDKNEHKITNEGLKQYGLFKLQQIYGQIVMKEARNYLTRETLRQIREGKLEQYIVAKKLKDKQKFKRYVKIFIEELQQGYLRKRLPRDKVAYLLRA